MGIYNADGSLLGEISYVVAKYTGRGHCELCDITHGTFRRKRSWDVAFGGSKTRVVQLVEDVANRRKVVVERVKYGGE